MRYTCVFLFVLLSSICYSQNFSVYISDAGNFNSPPWQILQVDENGQNPVTFIDTMLNWPQDILFMEDINEVLISNLGSNVINRHDATTGDYLGVFASGISGPTRTSIGPDSLLYVLQWSGNGLVKRYQLDGTYVDDFTDVGVPQSIGIAWDSVGNLYVSSYSGDYVRMFDTNGVDQGFFINAFLSGPTNIWFDTNGDMLVSDYVGQAVKRFNSNGVHQGSFLTGLAQSEGYAYLPNGDILIGNGNSSSVRRFDSNGNALGDFVAPGAGNLLTPNAVVIRYGVSVSLPEPLAQVENFVYPTAGEVFYLSQQHRHRVKTAEVLNLAGQLVGELDPDSGMQWDAQSQAEGIYVVKISLQDGSVASQRVLVRR